MLTLLLLLQDGWIPDGPAVKVAGGRVAVQSEKWAFLAAPGAREHAELAAELVIDEPARRKNWFGEHWSVWPDLAYDDGGYDAGVLLRGGYRVQLSHAYQDVALVKVPEGGYLRVAPCPVKLKAPHALQVSIQGGEIRVSVDGQERIRYVDRLRPLGAGRFGVGASGLAKAAFTKLSLRDLPTADAPAATPHVPNFSKRTWLGGRAWIFDGQEPVLLLPVKENTYINNVKLRPGWKPLLSWNSHWDVQTQGAFKEADNTLEAVEVTGGGSSIRASWSFRHVKNHFVVRASLTAGWDERRQAYTWDVESDLEVLAPFDFRYGYDFEHHTPLDPFRWQYLVVRREGGQIVHRPVYPIDPGQMTDVAQSGGARVWYGRHNGDLLVAPAVEYDLPEPGKRRMSTAVCAAFYDTGVSLGPEKAPAGTKVRVKYRYTGWPAAEAEALFQASKIHDSPMLDPGHHYVFADEWPKLTFTRAEPMSKTWIYGRRPFMSGHNQRPTYEWAKADGLKCGPGAYGKATLPAPSPLPAGRWVVRALVKSVNAHGPGGRIELQALDKNGNVLKQETRAFGPGSFDWTKIAFTTDVPGGAPALAVAFGNAGTGEAYFKDVEFAPGETAEVLPPKAPPTAASPAGALADWRMEEGSGLHVHDYAYGPFGKLELANLAWVVDEGRPALKFGPGGSGTYPRSGFLDRAYLGTPGYKERQGVPAALAGVHGGGFELPGLTLVAWIKPEAKLEKNKGDIVGAGARRFILGLSGGQAPYRLEGRLDVNDVFTSEPVIEAGRWQRVAMTCEAVDSRWRTTLWVDGRKVQEGTSKKLPAPTRIAPSCVLGTEIFYFHDGYYRGLIGRTQIYDRALTGAELK
jgi:hypothetical protein